MGINVILYRRIGYLETEDEICIGEPDWDTKKVEWWDTIRYAGDQEVINNIDWRFSNTFDTYLRPKNIDDAIDWVLGNLKYNELRANDWVKAFNEMKSDPELYFYVSR